MNWYKIFYLLSVADNIRGVFWFLLAIAIIGIVVSIFVMINSINIDENGDGKIVRRMTRPWLIWSIVIFITSMIIVTFVPSKKNTLLIIAGGGTMEFLSNDSTAKQIPHEVLDYLKTELKVMAKDAKVDLGVASQKDKIIEEAKTMTTNELLDRMKIDSTFAKIILDK